MAAQAIGNFLQTENFSQQIAQHHRQPGEKKLFQHRGEIAADVLPDQLQPAERGERAQRRFDLVLRARGKSAAPGQTQQRAEQDAKGVEKGANHAPIVPPAGREGNEEKFPFVRSAL